MQSRIVHLLSRKEGKARDIYRDIVDSLNSDYTEPHVFVDDMMKMFESLQPPPDRSVHGAFFEYVIGETLLQKDLQPYYQAEALNVPLAKFDWFLYHPERPVSISCKTKPRERWKQAAYEGMSLKRVYMQAKNYLVCLEEMGDDKQKFMNAPQTIDRFVMANSRAYSNVLNDVANLDFEMAQPVSPIINGKTDGF